MPGTGKIATPRFAFALLIAAAASLLISATASAGPIQVVNTDDDGPGSLRAAIEAADSNPSPDVITFAPTAVGTITLTTGELNVGSSLTIQGPGASVVAVSGNEASQVLHIAPDISVGISGLTIRDGREQGLPLGLAIGGGISNAADLTLTDMVVTENVAIGSNGPNAPPPNFGSGAIGGGIWNGGELTLIRTTVSNNIAQGGAGGSDGTTAGTPGGGQGGGIYNDEFNTPTLTLMDSTVSGNQAIAGAAGAGTTTFGGSGLGGGVAAKTGSASLTRTSVAGNSATGTAGSANDGSGLGGGIYATASMSISGSTISANVATSGAAGTFAGGGGIQDSGGASAPLSLTNSTVTGNSTGPPPANGGGGLSHSSGVATLRGVTIASNNASAAANVLAGNGAITLENAIVADPLGGGANCQVSGPGTITSQGHNLEDGASCSFTQAGDKPSAEPSLAALADNGGPTETMALAPGSPALDAGAAAGLATDQRGISRPQDLLSIPNIAGGSDIGAFELQAPAAPRCGGVRATLTGTNAGERIRGTRRRDVILAGGGRDRVSGLRGGDVVCGGAGADLLRGGAGRDRLLGGPGPDRLRGGPGRDLLRGGPGRDRHLQ